MGYCLEAAGSKDLRPMTDPTEPTDYQGPRPVQNEEAVDWCIQCCDGALTDEQRRELRSRIGTLLLLKDEECEKAEIEAVYSASRTASARNAW